MPLTKARQVENLKLIYPPGTSLTMLLILDTVSSFAAIANASLDQVATTTPHGFIENTAIEFLDSLGALPAPLNTSNTYYAIQVTASNFKVSLTSGGAAIDLTTNGNNFTVQRKDLDSDTSDLIQWVSEEASYTARQIVTVPGGNPTVNPNTGIASYSSVETVWYNEGSNSIRFNKSLLIRNGTTTPGNTTGTVDSYVEFVGEQVIQSGEQRKIIVNLSLLS